MAGRSGRGLYEFLHGNPSQSDANQSDEIWLFWSDWLASDCFLAIGRQSDDQLDALR